jgi:multidrug resistance efflux pump
VKAGDPIARIENPAVDAELAQRYSDWERARLRFSALQSDSSWRALELMPEAAKAMDQARTEMDRIQADHDRLILRTTMDGVVWGRNLEQLIGRYADTQGVLLRIADPTTLRLLIAVPEEKAEVIEEGNPVKGRWRADGRSFTTTVRNVPRQPANLREYTAGMLSVFGGAAPLTAQTHPGDLPSYPIYLVEAHLDSVPEQLTVEGMRAQVTIQGRQTTYAARLGRWFMRLLGFKNHRV